MINCKRYLLFAGEFYYPGGGWEDFHGMFDTPEEAEAQIHAMVGTYYHQQWAQIVDLLTGTREEYRNRYNTGWERR